MHIVDSLPHFHCFFLVLVENYNLEHPKPALVFSTKYAGRQNTFDHTVKKVYCMKDLHHVPPTTVAIISHHKIDIHITPGLRSWRNLGINCKFQRTLSDSPASRTRLDMLSLP